jgi:hypothetical protein
MATVRAAAAASSPPTSLKLALEPDGQEQVDRQQLQHRIGELQLAADQAGDRTEQESEDDGGEQVRGEQVHSASRLDICDP